ncbi:MAG TPA: hypothetical protein VMT34_05970 [Aggregatilineales bacterium]|nr:hypothetical protein [Aggregatilineales bacterium]
MPTIATEPVLEADRLWGERPMGASSVGLFLYQQGSKRCLRYLANVHNAQVHSVCETSPQQTLIATANTEHDSANAVFTVIAGRAINTRITAVSIEMLGGDSNPAVVQDEGFLVVLPGSQSPTRAVPIDEHGNLVGNMFNFGTNGK